MCSSSNQCLYDNSPGFVFSFYSLRADNDVGFASVSKRESVMVSSIGAYCTFYMHSCRRGLFSCTCAASAFIKC